MKLSRLDACEDWKIVRWCRTQASSHNSQGVINSEVNKVGMSTAAPDRCAVLLWLNARGLGWLFAELLLHHPNWSQKATSGARRMMSASCQVQSLSKVAICRSHQCFSFSHGKAEVSNLVLTVCRLKVQIIQYADNVLFLYNSRWLYLLCES